ncbi:hypothetical protein D3C73_997880 [compost metagenome]
MNSCWNASSIIKDRHRTVLIQGNVDFRTILRQMLVDSIINNLPYQMMKSRRARTTDIHTWSFAYRNKPFEHLNVVRVVSRSRRAIRGLGGVFEQIDLFRHSCSPFILLYVVPYTHNANRCFVILVHFNSIYPVS